MGHKRASAGLKKNLWPLRACHALRIANPAHNYLLGYADRPMSQAIFDKFKEVVRYGKYVAALAQIEL